MAQDAAFRAEWIERRARVAEEGAWSLAAAAALALAGDMEGRSQPSRLAADAHGHVWTEIPEEESVALVSGRSPDVAEAARRDVERTRVLAPMMAELRRRRPTIRDVSLWTASGAMRYSPWLDVHRANRDSGGELERFVFNRVAGFPEARPASGDVAVWTGVYAGPSMGEDPRTASVFVPVRNAAGKLVAGIALDVDPASLRGRGVRDVGASGRLLVRDRRGGARPLDDAARGGGARLERRRGLADHRRTLAGAEAPRRQGAPGSAVGR